MQLDDLLRRVRKLDPCIDSRDFGALDALYCFRLLLGRMPDPNGWDYWKRQRLSLDVAVTVFQASEESRVRRTAPPELVTTKRDFEIFIDPTDATIGRDIHEFRDYEAHVSAFFSRELSGKSGTFVDVGCNIGWYLLLAQVASPGLRLVGFEPNPANVSLSLMSLHRRGLIGAMVYPFALSDSDCFLGLHFAGSNGAVSEPRANTLMVKGVEGDRFVEHEDKVILIKIDVEGHEARALSGLRKTVARHRPVLLSEFHPRCLQQNGQTDPKSYLDQIMEMGYSLAIINDDSTGSETPCRRPAEVMAAWSKHNRMRGASGELHLDLVARPTR